MEKAGEMSVGKAQVIEKHRPWNGKTARGIERAGRAGEREGWESEMSIIGVS